MTQANKKLAVVLFNLGGPDTQEAVKPFLINLFRDKRIIGLPNPFRWALAHLIGHRRSVTTRGIYALLGGGSPLLENTKAQAAALEAQLTDAKVFIAMRYWHPMARETAKAVADYAPDRIVFLPLYPQYSTTTTASSAEQFLRELKRADCTAPTTILCCYPTESGFISSVAKLTAAAIDEAKNFGLPRVLFSAHGLPEKIIARGDPYQWQCEQTAKAIAAHLPPETEWLNSYQSRVGPLQWIKPATDDEIRRAGVENRPLVVVPIAFVSEHSETLVELDIEYKHVADEAGVPAYIRVATAGVEEAFIAGLANLVKLALANSPLPAGEVVSLSRSGLRETGEGATSEPLTCSANAFGISSTSSPAGRGEIKCLSQTGSRLCPSTYKNCAFKEFASNTNKF